MGGLATYGKQLALEAILPNGTSFYAGYLTTLPSDDAGTGLVEASGSSYARKVHSAWVDVDVSGVKYRSNIGAIEFVELTAKLADVVGWGIWDAGGGGNLIAWGPLLDVDENSITRSFAGGNQPRFVSQELQVGID